jgi:hypothetical protein
MHIYKTFSYFAEEGVELTSVPEITQLLELVDVKDNGEGKYSTCIASVCLQVRNRLSFGAQFA